MFNPKRLVELRKKRNLTQEQLAHKVKTTKGTISNYENGHSTPPHETLVAIADALGVSTDYLLGRTNDPTPPQQSESDEIKLSPDLMATARKIEDLAKQYGMKTSDPLFQEILAKAFDIAATVNRKNPD